MKTKIILVALLLIVTNAFSQSNSINYKALIKDGSGNVVANQNITVQFQILKGDGMILEYQETHTPTTDANGIAIVNIGEGNSTILVEGIPYTYVFTDIDWGTDNHFLNVQIDTGSGLTDMGTTQFMAVPYALSAANAASKIDELSDGKSDGASLFLGIDAGNNDDGSDNYNVGIGYQALYSNITGILNTAIGYHALYSNSIGAGNTATGFSALISNITGNYNTGNGYYSLANNTSGNFNTANGAYALNLNRGSVEVGNEFSGNNNTATGYSALLNNNYGFENTANGVRALSSNTTGFRNTANGYESLYFNDAEGNTANGYQALYHNISAHFNTANGFQALYSNTTGYLNTANGADALYSNTEGNFNTANGKSALRSNTIGYFNTATGYNAMYNNISGFENTATGNYALNSNTEGNLNTANGKSALYNNETGNENTAIGNRTLFNNLTGIRGTAIGYEALFTNTIGNYNTAVGYKSLYSLGLGNWNTAIGREALSNLSSGTNNIGIGYNAQASSTTASNQVTIGNSSNNVYRMYASSWTNASDAKLKHAIQNIPVGLDFVLKLRPVEFVYNNANNEEKTFGFIAQEIKEAVKQSNLEDNILVSLLNEDYLGLRTTELISVLTKAIQEQQEIIESQNEKLNIQDTNYKKLLKRVEQLEFASNQ